MKSIECSSRGYKKASAMYARVKCFGVIDTIENHYQSVKRDKYGKPVAKGRRVDHIVFNGSTFVLASYKAFFLCTNGTSWTN